MHKESRIGALLFFCPAVRKEIPVGFRSEVLQVGRLVQHVGEIVEEVDAVASAGAGQAYNLPSRLQGNLLICSQPVGLYPSLIFFELFQDDLLASGSVIVEEEHKARLLAGNHPDVSLLAPLAILILDKNGMIGLVAVEIRSFLG